MRPQRFPANRLRALLVCLGLMAAAQVAHGVHQFEHGPAASETPCEVCAVYERVDDALPADPTVDSSSNRHVAGSAALIHSATIATRSPYVSRAPPALS